MSSPAHGSPHNPISLQPNVISDIPSIDTDSKKVSPGTEPHLIPISQDFSLLTTIDANPILSNFQTHLSTSSVSSRPTSLPVPPESTSVLSEDSSTPSDLHFFDGAQSQLSIPALPEISLPSNIVEPSDMAMMPANLNMSSIGTLPGTSFIPSSSSLLSEGLYASDLSAKLPGPSHVSTISIPDGIPSVPANGTALISSFPTNISSISALPKMAGISVPPELSSLSSVAFSSAPLSSKISAIAASPLVPTIPGMELLNEMTPLLQSVKRIPWFQVSIILFLQVVEPLTTHAVSPFTPQLIRDSIGNIGTNEQLEYVAGLLQSTFYFMEASTVLYWSRTSDKVGRKPVILIGLLGSSLSMVCFGISQSLWGSILSRFLINGLNGNAGVIKGMMAEMVDAADLARIYAFTPLAYSAGASIGPVINNYLSGPSGDAPDTNAGTGLSGQSTTIPNIFLYLLACSVPTMLSIISFVVTFFFLKETVKSPAPITTLFKAPPSNSPNDPEHNDTSQGDATNPIQSLHLRAPKLQDSLALGGAVASAVVTKLPFDPNKLLSMRSLLTLRVIIAIGNFACLSLIDITFKSLQSLFLSTPVALGGLGLPPDQIDSILSAYGVLNGAVQLILFEKIYTSLGPKKMVVYGVASAVPLFLIFPVTGFLARHVGPGVLLWLALGVQVVLPIGFSLAFGAIFLYISAAPPDPATIGTTNGLSQMLANSMRGIGPGLVAGLFALSIDPQEQDRRYNPVQGNLVYIVLALIAMVSMMAASFLPQKMWTRDS